MNRYSWTQPICAACYAKREPGREPVKMRGAVLETCVDCGLDTHDGIYARVDPNEAKFPTRWKNSE